MPLCAVLRPNVSLKRPLGIRVSSRPRLDRVLPGTRLRQALFALVYRTKNVFEGGAISGSGSRGDVSCTCDDVMQVACDALGKGQHPEVCDSAPATAEARKAPWV